ncbi:HAD-IA family hydrolase [Sphingomonas sp. LB-2]|uniref:HAD family hydrolase n=1 Tax=Sphingomonas caeni TaxID=2984949 RepID=UPI002232C305|nr:HAD-IA family hydrolase [Sphingomonas caeni]MCW3845652.1 HAD-IA family hydrolase [Sphingomonas caeni]
MAGAAMHNFFDIVGFDLDGTLFDTAADIAAAANHVLALEGRTPLPAAALKPMIGLGGPHLLEQALKATGGCDEGAVARLFPEWLRYYGGNLVHETRPFPGLIAAMDALDARGVKIAIVTNKREAFAVSLVEQLRLTHRFATIIGGDTMGPGNAKPSPLPIEEMIRRCGGGRAAFVGDSIFDTLAAKRAGIPSIAVSFGFLQGPVEELEADAVIDHYDALIPALERLGSA